MAVFEHPSYDNHEQVTFCYDKLTGLKAIIAIHNTKLGPAVGGCRMWNYTSDNEALTDVLRLSKGMSYKNAMAGLTMGGGKSVIFADPHTQYQRQELFEAFGRCLNDLNGRYYSAEDVGVTTMDMKYANNQTPYVTGLEGHSGDPSPFTALGTYLGIKAAVKYQRGNDNLHGLSVAVQGIGHVGYYLCEYLYKEGVKLIVTDIHSEAISQVVNDFNATPVAPQQIYNQDVDIYAPCALGATINDSTLPFIKASIIAGCANNQLSEARHGQELKDKGILYAPDYVINAGGIINISFENHYRRQLAIEKVEKIYDTLTMIFKESDRQNKATSDIADTMAQELLA